MDLHRNPISGSTLLLMLVSLVLHWKKGKEGLDRGYRRKSFRRLVGWMLRRGGIESSGKEMLM